MCRVVVSIFSLVYSKVRFVKPNKSTDQFLLRNIEACSSVTSKQLVHALACTIELWSTWEVRRARMKRKSNSSFLTALQTSHVLHNSIVHG